VKQGGFVLAGPALLYGAIAAGAVILALSLAVWVQTGRVEAWKGKHDNLVTQTKIIGDKRNADTKIENERLTKKAKEANEQTTILRAKFADASNRLRDNSTRRSYVPSVTTSTSRPDLSCYDRAELDRAIRDFTGNTGELVIEGESKSIDLDVAKTWAQGVAIK